VKTHQLVAELTDEKKCAGRCEQVVEVDFVGSARERMGVSSGGGCKEVLWRIRPCVSPRLFLSAMGVRFLVNAEEETAQGHARESIAALRIAAGSTKIVRGPPPLFEGRPRIRMPLAKPRRRVEMNAFFILVQEEDDTRRTSKSSPKAEGIAPANNSTK